MGAEVYLCIEVTNISIGAPNALLGVDKHTALPPPPMTTLSGDTQTPMPLTHMYPSLTVSLNT